MQEYCEICGGQTDQNNVFTKWGYQIFKCSTCLSGRTIIDKDFKPADIYTEDYFQGGQKDGYADYKGSEDALTQEFNKIIAQDLERILDTINRSIKNLLDQTNVLFDSYKRLIQFTFKH